jgi:hypothetical protein
MSARSHTALRIAAIAWIAVVALMPAAVKSSAPSPSSKVEAVAPAVQAAPQHALAPGAHGAAVARR